MNELQIRCRGVYNPGIVRPRLRIRPALLALLVAAFVVLYPQLDAMGYCDKGGCPDIFQSSNASGGGTSSVGSGGGPAGTSVGNAHGGYGLDLLAGLGLVAVLVAAPAHLSPRRFVLLGRPPGSPETRLRLSVS